jgi:hypothetical protein
MHHICFKAELATLKVNDVNWNLSVAGWFDFDRDCYELSMKKPASLEGEAGLIHKSAALGVPCAPCRRPWLSPAAQR